MTSSYQLRVRSAQNKGVTVLFGKWNFIIFPSLGEAKVSTVNSDLRDFVDVQLCMRTLIDICISIKV